jgi:glycosyltransferase involved in cell wall biosynthesis
MTLFSIVIITLNEKENIGATIRAARDAARTNKVKSIRAEIIVSDGGSNDGTLEVVRKLADKVIMSNKGRYNQLNEGARASKGDILLFLHADTLLPKGALLRIYKQIRGSCVIGGGFKKEWKWSKNVKLNRIKRLLFFIWKGFGNWIVRLIKTFPGDNALFVRKAIFEELGGFSPLWICEDFDLSLRLKRYARKKKCEGNNRRSRFVYLRAAVKTSTRRFEKFGFFKTFFQWFFIYWMWRLGMNSDRLKLKFTNYKMLYKNTK